MSEGQCQAILKTGPNKGRQCGNYSTKCQGLCAMHQRSVCKNKVVPLFIVTGVPVEVPVETPKEYFDMEKERSGGMRRWLCM
jgi:hypothetical protein